MLMTSLPCPNLSHSRPAGGGRRGPGIIQGPIPSIIHDVIDRFGGVFPKEIPAGLPPSRPTDHRIDLVPDAVTPCYCSFRNCHEEEVELRRHFDEYLAHGWIEHAQSAFVAGVLFAKKHDGTKRMCVDYWRLNDPTQRWCILAAQ